MFRLLFILTITFSNSYLGQFASVPLSLYQQFNGPFDNTTIGKSHNLYDNWALYNFTSMNLTLCF
jgi:hypothetical protein